ncbi:hypothetical protein PDJAM_G00180310 [Pangasius djambal]|uniref:Uncharacterized protein n=1 Tax=Pangasius djambal TaxID=1691987 RepID=A0ACC5ZR57_9TELE|nr:hypothetical protein [Pangasius djambal]
MSDWDNRAEGERSINGELVMASGYKISEVQTSYSSCAVIVATPPGGNPVCTCREGSRLIQGMTWSSGVMDCVGCPWVQRGL